MMKYVQIPGVAKPLSRLVYGTGVRKLNSDDKKLAAACLDQAYEAGFRVFDTAHSYGRAEENLGAWIKSRGVRDDIVILDKGCNPGQNGSPDIFSAETIREHVKMSQERLQTGFLDLYILHRDDPSRPVGPIVEVLNELHEAGVIGLFGGSNWTLARVLEANRYAAEHGLKPFSAVSPNYSLGVLERDPWGGSVTLSGAQGTEYREWLAQNRLPVFTYSSISRGFFSGKYDPDSGLSIEDCLPPSPIKEYDSPDNRERLRRAWELSRKKGTAVSTIALAWLLAQPQNIFPIVSPTGTDHIVDNIAALELELTAEECRYLSDVHV